ncbi:DsbA family protein [Haladaptatus halobius]|uniref:DsbA family protein n=1 Tax=Haladaptatus halobius TaxID=2884875 RepID=UPI001D0ABE2A|nr:DsbA family protein [Haladaptatus halobius]
MNQSRVSQLAVPVSERDHVDGAVDAPVTLVEYGDYGCPYCEDAYRAVKAVRGSMQGSVRFVFRHFPLTSLHPHAQRAAEAAEAAAAQGKFWEMHDLLFEHSDSLSEESLFEYATAIDLDTDRFGRELDDGTYVDRVHEDLISGTQSGVIGTPTFFIDGERYDEQWDADTLRAALEDAL